MINLAHVCAVLIFQQFLAPVRNSTQPTCFVRSPNFHLYLIERTRLSSMHLYFPTVCVFFRCKIFCLCSNFQSASSSLCASNLSIACKLSFFFLLPHRQYLELIPCICFPLACHRAQLAAYYANSVALWGECVVPIEHEGKITSAWSSGLYHAYPKETKAVLSMASIRPRLRALDTMYQHIHTRGKTNQRGTVLYCTFGHTLATWRLYATH